MGFPLLLKLSFSAFAIVYIVRYTDGPFDLFVMFREWVGIKVYDLHEGEQVVDYIEEVEDRFFAKLFSCFWCMTTWVSLILIVVFYKLDILAWFACIGMSGFLHEIVVRNDGKV